MSGDVRNPIRKAFSAFSALGAAALLAACGGGGGSSGSQSFPVSVKVTGLTSGTLTLQDNGSDSVTVYGNTTSTFGTQIAAGTLYDVTVSQQPPGQNCVVLSGAGAANGNVSVNVVCSPSTSNAWTWMAGSQTASLVGSYGTVGVPGGFPGARYGAASWADASGNLWLFGGDAVVSASSVGFFNDLWKFDTASGTWTWWGPAASNDAAYQSGVSNAGSSSYPGARIFASTWFNRATGQTWLFGGFGCGNSGGCSSSTVQLQNDLWTFTPTGGWTLINGGASSPSSSYPGARFGAATWIDQAGNLWLFGGSGLAIDGSRGDLSDLWKYVPATRTWTIVSGAHTASTTPLSGNTCSLTSPPARQNAVSWFDGTNLWLFGGAVASGSSSSTTLTFYADLWEYMPSTSGGTWQCWPGNPPGGNRSPPYTPAARYEGVSWVDPNTGLFWLYGGEGYTGPGAGNGTPGYFNDLWYFNPGALPPSGSVQQWTQVNASDTQGGCTTTPGSGTNGTVSPWCPGTYTSLGAASTSNLPGARYGSVGWVDNAGEFWLFGGDGYDSSSGVGDLNDLWRYVP